jgi:hypothetical protein
MVVKFADTQKEKDQKRIHQATANLWGIGGLGMNNMTPQYLTVSALLQVSNSTFQLICMICGAGFTSK